MTLEQFRRAENRANEHVNTPREAALGTRALHQSRAVLGSTTGPDQLVGTTEATQIFC